MASLRHDRRMAVPANVVWDVIRRPESIPEWFPGIVSCTVVDSVRTVTTASGIEMAEQIMTIDSTQRRFVYRITSPMYKFHLGIIDVIELGPNDTLCVYSTTAEPDPLALVIAGGTVGALAEIQRIAETRMKA